MTDLQQPQGLDASNTEFTSFASISPTLPVDGNDQSNSNNVTAAVQSASTSNQVQPKVMLSEHTESEDHEDESIVDTLKEFFEENRNTIMSLLAVFVAYYVFTKRKQ